MSDKKMDFDTSNEQAASSLEGLEEVEEAGSDLGIKVVLQKVAKKDPESARKIERFLISQHVSYRGPMPSPSDLAEYAQVQPDLPERIMLMAEQSLASKSTQGEKLLVLKDKELEVRAAEIKSNADAHKREVTLQLVSLVLAFIALIVCLLGAFYLAVIGHKELALLLGGTTIVAVVASFLKGRLEKKE